MKKMLAIIVPLALLVSFTSVGFAAEEGTDSTQELNQELNQDLVDSKSTTLTNEGVDDVETGFDPVELNDTNSREANSLASKRGRQARRGSTASTLSDVQKYWGDHNSGKSADEGADEDEDDDMTPV
jgi:hypothetical protein